jgi:tetratricopeptide (TPR) repeat protein
LNEEALVLFDKVGDRQQQNEALWQLALAAELKSDYVRARSCHQQRLAFISPDDTLSVARIEHDLGRLTFTEGRYDEAIALLSQAISTFRAHADAQLIAHGLLDLSSAELLNGQADASLGHIDECITLLHTIQDDYGLAIATVTRGRAEQLAGEYRRAQATLEQSLADADRLGDASLRSLALYGLGVNAVALGNWDEAVSRLRAAYTANQQIGDRRRTAEILEVMSQAAIGAGHIEEAARLMGGAQRERRDGLTVTPPAHLPRLTTATKTARAALGSDRFDMLVDQGQALDVATLIAQV